MQLMPQSKRARQAALGALVAAALLLPMASASAATHHWRHHHGHGGATTTTTSTLVKPTTSTVKATTTTAAPTATTAAPSTTVKPTTTTVKPTTTTIGPVTTLPPVSNGKNCASKPSACGYPDATNTGVPAGAALIKVPSQATSGNGWVWSGDHIDARTDNVTISNLDIDGNIELYGNNVTIKNVRITASGETWGVGMRHANNTTIEDSTFTSPVQFGPLRMSVAIKDIYGDTTGGKFLRNDISHMSTGIQTANGLVQDNYLHDFGLADGDHINGVSVGGGDLTPMLIQHNTILNNIDQTDAIALFQDFGGEANKTIDNNLLAGGSYSLYGGGSNGCTGPATSAKCDPSDHIVVTNNRFSRIFFPTGGTYGPVANFNSNGVGNVWTGNIWDDTLVEVQP